MQKNLLMIKNAILAVFGSYCNNYFCVFSKILTKITFMCLLFLKLKQKKKGYNFSLRFLFQNSKMAFFGGQPIFFLFIFSVKFFTHTWPLVTWPVLTDETKFPHTTLPWRWSSWWQTTPAWSTLERSSLYGWNWVIGIFNI